MLHHDLCRYSVLVEKFHQNLSIYLHVNVNKLSVVFNFRNHNCNGVKQKFDFSLFCKIFKKMKRVRGVLCGEASVGKSALLRCFSDQPFQENSTSTIAGAFYSKIVTIKNEKVNLEIWDTAGSERYHSVIPSFFRSASAIAIIYDITSRDSFEKLKYWSDFASMNAPPQATVFVVGNKIDLEESRNVTYEEGKRFAQSIEAKSFLETSAKTGEAVDGLFTLFANVEGVMQPDTAKASVRKEKDGCC